jgi:hypothetical protein
MPFKEQNEKQNPNLKPSQPVSILMEEHKISRLQKRQQRPWRNDRLDKPWLSNSKTLANQVIQ